jgi:hypothetical protein
VIYSSPGITAGSYVSSMVSPYNVWFREMGHPLLDILQYEDGEWCIIQYLRSPVVPSLTQFTYVLRGIRNTSITPGFVQRFVDQLDPFKRAFWDREEAKTKDVYDEGARVEREAEDTAERLTKSFMANPDLVARVAKNGFGELNPMKIMRHVNPIEAREILKKCT